MPTNTSTNYYAQNYGGAKPPAPPVNTVPNYNAQQYMPKLPTPMTSLNPMVSGTQNTAQGLPALPKTYAAQNANQAEGPNGNQYAPGDTFSYPTRYGERSYTKNQGVGYSLSANNANQAEYAVNPPPQRPWTPHVNANQAEGYNLNQYAPGDVYSYPTRYGERSYTKQQGVGYNLSARNANQAEYNATDVYPSQPPPAPVDPSIYGGHLGMLPYQGNRGSAPPPPPSGYNYFDQQGDPRFSRPVYVPPGQVTQIQSTMGQPGQQAQQSHYNYYQQQGDPRFSQAGPPQVPMNANQAEQAMNPDGVRSTLQDRLRYYQETGRMPGYIFDPTTVPPETTQASTTQQSAANGGQGGGTGNNGGGQWVLDSANGGTGDSYTVQSGDSLIQIANRLGLNYMDIARLNGISNPNLIHPGQVLRLPGGAGGGSSDRNWNAYGQQTGNGQGGGQQSGYGGAPQGAMPPTLPSGSTDFAALIPQLPRIQAGSIFELPPQLQAALAQAGLADRFGALFKSLGFNGLSDIGQFGFNSDYMSPTAFSSNPTAQALLAGMNPQERDLMSALVYQLTGVQIAPPAVVGGTNAPVPPLPAAAVPPTVPELPAVTG